MIQPHIPGRSEDDLLAHEATITIPYSPKTIISCSLLLSEDVAMAGQILQRIFMSCNTTQEAYLRKRQDWKCQGD